MSEWITDRRPTENDADVHNNVYNRYGVYTHWVDIDFGEPWMRTNRPEPYVKPTRYTVKWLADTQCWAVMDSHYVVLRLAKLHRYLTEHREAAERIAAIYEEVMP